MTTASQPPAWVATSAMVECSAIACSARVPMTRAPNVPVTATISVPEPAATRASAVTFSVTTADVFELTTRMRTLTPSYDCAKTAAKSTSSSPGGVRSSECST